MPHDAEGPENDVTPDDDDDAGAETPDNGGEESGETPSTVEPVSRPRARRAAPHVEIGPFGAVPVNARAWGMTKARPGGDWEVLKYGDAGTLNEEWPVDGPPLTVDLVRERWGAGTFRVSWWTATPRGGKKFVCHGRTVTLESDHVPSSASVSSSPSVSAFEEGLRFMKLVKEHAAGSMTEAMQLAQFFATMQQGRSAGVTGEELRAILRDEREAQSAAHTAAIRAAVEPLERRIAELADEDDDEDDDGEPLADAARAAGPALFKGRKWWQQVGAYATANPEVVKTALPIIAGAVQNIAGVVASAVAAPKPPPQRVRAQITEAPRVHVEKVETSPPAQAAPSSKPAWQGEVITAEPPPASPTPVASSAAAE